MEQPRSVSASPTCWNLNCLEYGLRNSNNIRKFGATNKGSQRYQCRACKTTFSEGKGTLFYGRHHSQEAILECLALRAKGHSLEGIHQRKGIKGETVSRWVKEAAEDVEQVEGLLLANYDLTQGQVDSLWMHPKIDVQHGATSSIPAHLRFWSASLSQESSRSITPRLHALPLGAEIEVQRIGDSLLWGDVRPHDFDSDGNRRARWLSFTAMFYSFMQLGFFPRSTIKIWKAPNSANDYDWKYLR